MKISCLQENLVQGINATAHLALRATSLPILKNVLLKTEHKLLTVTATNLESGIRTQIRGKVEEDGECLVPAKLLLDLLPLLPEGPVELQSTDEGLTITTSQASTTLRTNPTSDFPTLPGIDQFVLESSVSARELKTALEGVLFAAGAVEHRPQFNGVFCSVNGKTLTLAATDGFRLAETVIMLSSSVAKFQSIIPSATVQELLRVLDEGEEEALVTGSETQLAVTVGGTFIISRLIGGQFPDYLPLFPEQASTSVIIGRANFVRAMKAATLFSRAGMSEISLVADPKTGTVRVGAENAEVGAHQNSVEAEITGEETAIILNARYLVDALNALSVPTAVLQFSSADRPLLITPHGKSPIKMRSLIMPIRQ